MPRWLVYYHNRRVPIAGNWGTRQRGADRGASSRLGYYREPNYRLELFQCVKYSVHVESSIL